MVEVGVGASRKETEKKAFAADSKSRVEYPKRKRS